MKYKKLILTISIFIFLGFIFFSLLVAKEKLNGIDLAVTVKIQERIDNSSRLRSAQTLRNAFLLSESAVTAKSSFLIILTLTIYKVMKQKERKKKLMYILLPFFLLFLTGFEVLGKMFIHHPAPHFFLIKNSAYQFPKYYVQNQYSYPSGHTARVVFITLVLLILFLNKKKKILSIVFVLLLIIFIFFVSFGQIYLGYHWFSDIFGGVLLGVSFGLLSFGLSTIDQKST